MQGTKKYCSFFQNGNCKKGSNCSFVHEINPMGPGIPHKTGGERPHVPKFSTANSFSSAISGSNQMNITSENINNAQPQSKICDYFIKGSCNKHQCRFFHGYAENLQNINIEKIHEKNIIGMCPINDKKFITADTNSIQIWLITDTEHKVIGTQVFEEKITKISYSNEKVIVATQIEKMYGKLLSLGDEILYDSILILYLLKTFYF